MQITSIRHVTKSGKGEPQHALPQPTEYCGPMCDVRLDVMPKATLHTVDQRQGIRKNNAI